MSTQEQRVRAAALKLGVPRHILETVFLREGSSAMLDEAMSESEIIDVMARVSRRGGCPVGNSRIVEHVEGDEQDTGDAGEQFVGQLDAPRTPDELPDEFAEALDIPSRHGAGETLHQITERV